MTKSSAALTLPDINIYSTLTKKLEPLKPRTPPKLELFVCGPTVYDFSHLGHAKTYIQFDFIVKYLRARGFDVVYLQNITDIDDKIINRANREGISWDAVSRKFEQAYYEDMRALHNTAVTKYERASDHISAIVLQVKGLLQKGIAYKTGDGYYFDLSKFKEYGKLSGRKELKEEDAVSRIDESAEKRNWNDFCLWKFQKPDEPFWETELGAGRPGWHIEDTAITETVFGPQYDVHGGAIDLIFPHHEAEIAQMEALSGLKPLVRYWLHTGFLNINFEKMSKSKGNFRTIRETLKSYDYKVLRLFFISSHYRTTLNFTEETLQQAKATLDRLQEYFFKADASLDDRAEEALLKALRDKVLASLDNDFDTPLAFAEIFQFIRAQNTKNVVAGKNTLKLFAEFDTFFNCLPLSDSRAKETPSDPEIQKLIDERERFRKERKFKEADDIRDKLLSMGVQIYDTKDGIKWRSLS